MPGRCECLQQEHPEVGHEVAGDAVVRVIKQNAHDTPLKCSLAAQSLPEDLGRSGTRMCTGGFPTP